jgi:hypothetical protein
MDEPTVGLDPDGRRAVWSHVCDLRDKMGAAIVFATHYLDEAEAMINAGHVAALGRPVGLKTRQGAGAMLAEVFSALIAMRWQSRRGRRWAFNSPRLLFAIPAARRTCAKRTVRRDLLWPVDDLGARSRSIAPVYGKPAPRSALVIGKALASSVGASVKRWSLRLLGALGVRLSFDPAHILAVVLFIVLGALLALFAHHGCIVKTRERFMGIGQCLTMPIFFASNAIYPIAIMPDWLRAIANAIRSRTKLMACKR